MSDERAIWLCLAVLAGCIGGTDVLWLFCLVLLAVVPGWEDSFRLFEDFFVVAGGSRGMSG